MLSYVKTSIYRNKKFSLHTENLTIIIHLKRCQRNTIMNKSRWEKTLYNSILFWNLIRNIKVLSPIKITIYSRALVMHISLYRNSPCQLRMCEGNSSLTPYWFRDHKIQQMGVWCHIFCNVAEFIRLTASTIYRNVI